MESIAKYALENRLEVLLVSTASAILLHQLVENRDYFFGYDQFATKQIVSGLTNYSQLCYANSMLQLIATMPEYNSYFKQLHEKYITTENQKSAKVLSSIITTIERINRVCPAGSFFDASTKLIALLASDSKWATSQQDCLELWTRMESAIEHECHRSISQFGFLSYKSSKTADPFKWPTHFSTLREMVCTICGKRKDSRVEKLHMLTLDQKYSPNTLLTDLESSLEHYFKPETLIVNCEGCSTCTTSDGGDSGGSSVMPSFDSSPEISLQDSIHKKTLSFASLPKYLCIQVTALWDPVSGNSFRNLRPWRYPDCLDLSKYCFLQQFQIEKTFNSKIYHLEAVIVHVGFDNCGHYYTLRKIDNAWYMCNDALIQRVVTGLNHTGAYILLYTR
jgi:uncharacterized UBP type Zn finger protein